MRTTQLALCTLTGCLLLGASVPAQGNRVIRNNQPYLVISTATNATTGVNYNWPPMNPPEYSATGTGVIPDTWTWRVITNDAHDRGAGSNVDGFTMVNRQTAGSGGNWATDYTPETRLVGTVARTGGGEDPDGTQLDPANPGAALVAIAQGPLASPGQTYRVDLSIAPVLVPPQAGPGAGQGVAVATRFAGGEQQDSVTGHGNCGSWQDGQTPFETAGFYYPGTSTTLLSTDPGFKTWLTFTEAEATINMFSDWGQRRIAPLSPPILGHSIGTYYSDLGTAASSTLGFSFRSSGNPGDLVFPLINVGLPTYNLPFPLPLPGGPASIDLNVGDPTLFALINAGLFFQLDGAGEYDQGVTLPTFPGAFGGPAFTLGNQAAAIGQYLGFEGVVISATTFKNLGDTQGVWIQI